MSDEIEWWEEEAGFFGEFYMRGDNSVEGYLAGKDQSLQQRTDIEVCGVEKLLGLHPGDKILDCPCGYGRHSIELAKKGYQVVASDNNSVHMNTLSQYATQEQVFLTLDLLDMRKPPCGSNFDAVINMFFSFGFF